MTTMMSSKNIFEALRVALEARRDVELLELLETVERLLERAIPQFRDNPEVPPLAIEVLSRPVTQGSKKPFLHYHTGRAMMKEDNGERLKNWRADVRAAAEPYRGRFAAKEPLRVVAHFTLPKPVAAPKRRKTWPTAMRNDLEKLLRSTYDALTSSGVWHDDSQVMQEMSSKSYPGEGDGPNFPGVRLLIYSLLPVSAT